ncbi:MAG: hypothetical protein EOM51_11940 [Clostridia bacterium]|nr:hypothetical protein [Clostridia bacterium]
MKKETFVQGVTILEETYNRTLNRAIAWELLRGEEDVSFLGAVRMMVVGLKTLFPNDNVVAIVLDYISSFKQSEYQKKLNASNSMPALDWTPCPPPEEWNQLKEKLKQEAKA